MVNQCRLVKNNDLELDSSCVGMTSFVADLSCRLRRHLLM